MINPEDKNAGDKLTYIRKSLFLSKKEIKAFTGIPETTLGRIENGILPYPIKRLQELCSFYTIVRDILYDNAKIIPDWKILKRRILAANRDNIDLIDALNKKPSPKDAIEFRLLVSVFLNEYRTTKDIRDHLFEKYKWTFKTTTLSNSLSSLEESKLIKTEKINGSVFQYRKASPNEEKSTKNTTSFQLLEHNLSQLIPDLAPQILKKITAIIFFLNQGPKKRKEILNHIDYANITKNYNKTLEVLVKRELAAMTIPEKPTSSIQEYILTKEGCELLEKVGVKV